MVVDVGLKFFVAFPSNMEEILNEEEEDEYDKKMSKNSFVQE